MPSVNVMVADTQSQQNHDPEQRMAEAARAAPSATSGVKCRPILKPPAVGPNFSLYGIPDAPVSSTMSLTK